MPTTANLYPGTQLHTPLSSLGEFTDAHFQQFHEQGFLAVQNVLTSDQVEAAKAGLTHLIDGHNPDFKDIEFEIGIDVSSLSGQARERHVRKLMYFSGFDQRLGAIANHPELVKTVEWLVGAPVRMVQDMALLKPPHVGREKPWHQDNAYFMLAPLNGIIGTWTALDEATLSNGCMHLIPGSHRRGPLAHYHDRDCQIPDEKVAVEQSIAVPLKPGGTLFFYGLLQHGTPANQSPDRRRALQFHYASIHCKPTTPQEHAGFFHDEKGMAACAGMKARKITDRQ